MFRLSKGFGHAALKASVRRNAVCCFVTANRLQQACAVVSYGRGRGLKTVQSIQQESIRKPSETSGEIPYSSVEKDQQNRKRIKKIIQKRNYGEIINAMHEARAHNTDLDMVDYVAGIDACVLRASFTGSEIAFWIYQKLKAESVIPAEVYIKLLCLCRQLEDVDKAVEIAEEFTSSGYTMSNSFLTELILNLCYVDSNNRHGIQALTYYYEESKRLKAEFGFHTSADVYMKVATAFCRVVESQKSLQVLRDMTEANHEPTAALCQDLLEMSLFTMDEVLLRVLASWYKNNFTDAKLEYGVLNRMIQVAASKGDGQLAQVTFQVLPPLIPIVKILIGYYII